MKRFVSFLILLIALNLDAQSITTADGLSAFTPGAPVAGSPCSSVNDGSLAVYFPLDEASGNRTDTKNGNILIANGTGGVGSTTGQIGNAANFNAALSQH